MKKLINILSLTILTILTSCSKDVPDPAQDHEICGTVYDFTWSQKVTNDSLTGNWSIGRISYMKLTGQTVLFDTVYTPLSPLTLNADGTGTLYSSQLNWALTISPDKFPTLTITNLDTLFPFQNNLFANKAIKIYVQETPHTFRDSYFLASAGSSGNIWESTYLTFERN
jgi:hypothetical protein